MSDDRQLIQRHLAGDRKAAAQLIRRHERMVLDLATRLLGPGEEARDAAQETFLNLLQALPGFRGEAAFTTWLYRIATNTCIARSKRRRQRRNLEESMETGDIQGAVADGDLSSQELLEQRERHAFLRRAIDELAEEYRAVVVLHYLQDMKYEQMAEVLGIPLGTVKVRLFRARRLLQRKLKSKQGEM